MKCPKCGVDKWGDFHGHNDEYLYTECLNCGRQYSKLRKNKEQHYANMLCKALKAAGNHVISILGARSENMLFYEDKMKAVSSELFITTDDGTRDIKGFVTDELKRLTDYFRAALVVWS